MDPSLEKDVKKLEELKAFLVEVAAKVEASTSSSVIRVDKGYKLLKNLTHVEDVTESYVASIMTEALSDRALSIRAVDKKHFKANWINPCGKAPEMIYLGLFNETTCVQLFAIDGSQIHLHCERASEELIVSRGEEEVRQSRINAQKEAGKALLEVKKKEVLSKIERRLYETYFTQELFEDLLCQLGFKTSIEGKDLYDDKRLSGDQVKAEFLVSRCLRGASLDINTICTVAAMLGVDLDS